MASLLSKPCPLDGSELLLTCGWYARPSKPDVEWAYCPRCDAAFQRWEEPEIGKQTMFTWKRKGQDLVLVDEDRAKVQEFLKCDWEMEQANMLHGVRSFLEHRFRKEQRCPCDGGGPIPMVAELPYHSGSAVRSYWCVYCGLLFAFLMDKDYGWQSVASFSWDKEKRQFVLYKNYGKKMDLDLIQERVATLSQDELMSRKSKNPNLKKWWQILLAVVLLTGLGVWLWLLWLERSYREEPYSLIEDGLYLGSAVAEPPPGTKAVLNLCGRKDPYVVDNLLWGPILESGKDPDLAWLRRMVEFIDTQQRAGNITFIHCMAGMNRSGMVVTAYLMFKHNWSRDQALDFVQSKRPQIQPNPSLLRLLSEWEKELSEQEK
jgi:hypothetical protein